MGQFMFPCMYNVSDRITRFFVLFKPTCIQMPSDIKDYRYLSLTRATYVNVYIYEFFNFISLL